MGVQVMFCFVYHWCSPSTLSEWCKIGSIESLVGDIYVSSGVTCQSYVLISTMYFLHEAWYCMVPLCISFYNRVVQRMCCYNKKMWLQLYYMLRGSMFSIKDWMTLIRDMLTTEFHVLHAYLRGEYFSHIWFVSTWYWVWQGDYFSH